MRLVTFELNSPLGPVRRLGLWRPPAILDVNAAYRALLARTEAEAFAERYAAVVLPPDLLGYLAAGEHGRVALAEVAQGWSAQGAAEPPAGRRTIFAETEVRLLAPLPRPNTIRDFSTFEQHQARVTRAKGNADVPAVWYEIPVYWKADPENVVGPEAEVCWPDYAEQLDYELEFGAYDDSVLARLHWMADVLAPAVRQAVLRLGGLDIRSITARALHMGDEAHNRDLAGTSLLFKALAPEMAASDLSRPDLVAVLDFLAHQEHFFLNVSMAACKAMLLAAEGIRYSTVVTALARNGVEVGVRVSGLGPAWFTAPATVPDGLYFPGFSRDDANPDLGDSAISETAGIGAFVMGGAPAIVQFVGGTPADALRYTEDMYRITVGENPNYTLPVLNFRGAPLGIDVRQVVETNLAPVINTGIAHREPGHGLVGAGVVGAPLACFEAALRAMAAWLD